MLAHALYACSQASFEPEDIFSVQGHAHAVATYNKSKLIAWHGDQDRRTDVTAVLKVHCQDWSELLRWKLSYSKWFLDEPTTTTFAKFGFTNPEDSNPLENLTIKYWNLLQIADTVSDNRYLLDDYVHGQVDPLRIAVQQIGWTWNPQRSDSFYACMKFHNQRYFDWLNTMKNIVQNCLDSQIIEVDLQFWEKAAVIAKICHTKNICPIDLHWNNYGCFLQTNNVLLLKSLERIQNGKTI